MASFTMNLKILGNDTIYTEIVLSSSPNDSKTESNSQNKFPCVVKVLSVHLTNDKPGFKLQCQLIESLIHQHPDKIIIILVCARFVYIKNILVFHLIFS